MIPEKTQEAMRQWLKQATPPERQLDRRWVGRYRELNAHDSFWWLSWAGPFTTEEQVQWDSLFKPPIDETTKEQLGLLLKQSSDRELEAALAENREPRLHYPAIEIDDVRRRIARLEELNAEIQQEEPNHTVRQLYHGAIEEEANYLRIIEATYEKDTQRFWVYNRSVFLEPTLDEMQYALSWVKRLIQQGFKQAETAESSQQLLNFIQDQLHLPLDLSVGTNDPPLVHELSPSTPHRVSVDVARRFYEAVLGESGYEGWQVSIDATGSDVTRVEWGLRQLILAEETFTVEGIRHLLAHELAGHVARSFAGEHSPIGLLGIGTQACSATEEGLALYHERRMVVTHGGFIDDSGPVIGMLATGLASGVGTTPQTFWSLCTFLEVFTFLYRRLLRPWREKESDQAYARRYALRRCLRTFRGVPDLKQAGVCYLQDVTYLRGLLQIKQAVSEDEGVLDRLAVGMVACDLLPVLRPLQIIPPPQPMKDLLDDPQLDDYILSFETSREDAAKPV